jgi:hypothetical protein
VVVDKPSLKVGDIFRTHGEIYRQTHPLSAAQMRAMSHIETCRTEVLGGHVDTCTHCGHKVASYNSCGDRHCPECQSFSQAKWIDGRKQRILPTGYFHTVFTLPAELRSLTLCNPTVVYDIFFKTAAETLIELGDDPKYLGGLLGLTAVLHTWTRELDYHPHIHIIVTAGGLTPDGELWVPSKPDFLFPVRVLSKLFRGKFLCALKHAREKSLLEFKGGCAILETKEHFSSLMSKLYETDWVVYCKEPFDGPGAVFEYLGRYTHRVGISNQRLISFDDDAVTFYTKDGKTKTLAPEEFIRRFLLHILPKGFTKIRHFGLLAPCNVNSKLERARELLEATAPRAAAALTAGQTQARERLESIRAEHKKSPSCPLCNCQVMTRMIVAAKGSSRGNTQERNTS